MPVDPAQIEISSPDPSHQAIINNLGIYFRYDLLPFLETGDESRLNRFGVIGDEAAATHEQSNAAEGIWWSKPDILLPMLIRFNDESAGFARVARPPHAHRSMDYRLNDFFIVNKFRRTGIGRFAAHEIFRRYPGRWELGWLPRNKPAELFWRCITKPWEPEEWPVPLSPGAPPLPGLCFTVRHE